jgi:hypothetical protein
MCLEFKKGMCYIDGQKNKYSGINVVWAAFPTASRAVVCSPLKIPRRRELIQTIQQLYGSVGNARGAETF